MIFASIFIGFVSGFFVAAALVRHHPIIDPNCRDCLAEAWLTELAKEVARRQGRA